MPIILKFACLSQSREPAQSIIERDLSLIFQLNFYLHKGIATEFHDNTAHRPINFFLSKNVCIPSAGRFVAQILTF